MSTLAIGDLVVELRPARPEDEGIVFHAWLTGHRENGDWPRFVAAWRYFGQHKLVLARLIARAQMLVACNLHRPTQVFGFACYETQTTLHWVWVKHRWRQKGIARHLLQNAGLIGHQGAGSIRCSHWSRAAQKLYDERHYPLVFNPFLLEDDYEATKDRVQRPLRDAIPGGLTEEGDLLRRLRGDALQPEAAGVPAQAEGAPSADGGPGRGGVVAGGGPDGDAGGAEWGS